MKELPDKIIDFADEYDMLPGGGLVIACVSGGADSMCLLEALLEISNDRGFTVGAAHYNHGLRGPESDRDENFVREYCALRGLPLYCGGGDVRVYAQERRLGLEEAARDLRYDFFCTTAANTGAVRIATAHTSDDNAETVIFNMVRGSGAAGLAGIPPVRDIVIRPMLRVSRDDVLGFLSERGIPFVVDSTNSDISFTRNKIRHTIMPPLREINPRLNEAITAASSLARADEEYMSDLAARFIGERCGIAAADDGYIYNPGSGQEAETYKAETTVEIADLLGLPLAVSGRVIRKLYGGNLSYNHVCDVLELCRGDNVSAGLSLPGGSVLREYGRIVFNPRDKKAVKGLDPVILLTGVPTNGVHIPGAGLKVSCKQVIFDGKIHKAFTSFLFKKLDICGNMTVRSRLEGDKIRLTGRSGTKSLKKLFIEHRIPAAKRQLIPIVADDRGVLAVYGLGAGDRAVPEPGDVALQIDFEEV